MLSRSETAMNRSKTYSSKNLPDSKTNKIVSSIFLIIIGYAFKISRNGGEDPSSPMAKNPTITKRAFTFNSKPLNNKEQTGNTKSKSKQSDNDQGLVIKTSYTSKE
jgi:hypothetical protein